MLALVLWEKLIGVGSQVRKSAIAPYRQLAEALLESPNVSTSIFAQAYEKKMCGLYRMNHCFCLGVGVEAEQILLFRKVHTHTHTCIPTFGKRSEVDKREGEINGDVLKITRAEVIWGGMAHSH